MNKSIILLSGGLDCATSLCLNREIDNIELALFFNYGQKSYTQEKFAAENLCKYYNLNLEVVDLNWLSRISTTALVSNKSIPKKNEIDLDNTEKSQNSMKKVWIPNRNGLFLNIAASYADSYNYDKIFIGANKEEASTFTDNSVDFIKAINEEFKYSTLVKPKVIAPLINSNKKEIIELAKHNNLPFNLLWSCYEGNLKHCGECESCKRLKRGLELNNLFDIVELLFGK